MSEIELLECIGRGSGSTVYKAINKDGEVIEDRASWINPCIQGNGPIDAFLGSSFSDFGKLTLG